MIYVNFQKRNDGEQIRQRNTLEDNVGHLKIRKSYQLVLDAEEAGGFKNDWTTHARPDIAIVRPLPS
jgi:hypothetical protein